MARGGVHASVGHLVTFLDAWRGYHGGPLKKDPHPPFIQPPHQKNAPIACSMTFSSSSEGPRCRPSNWSVGANTAAPMAEEAGRACTGRVEWGGAVDRIISIRQRLNKPADMCTRSSQSRHGLSVCLLACLLTCAATISRLPAAALPPRWRRPALLAPPPRAAACPCRQSEGGSRRIASRVRDRLADQSIRPAPRPALQSQPSPVARVPPRHKTNQQTRHVLPGAAARLHRAAGPAFVGREQTGPPPEMVVGPCLCVHRCDVVIG